MEYKGVSLFPLGLRRGKMSRLELSYPLDLFYIRIVRPDEAQSALA